MADEDELAALLRAAQAGDETAFRAIYRAQQPALLRYLTVLAGADAEDVASEAWLQIARDLPKFRGDGDGFRGWAATIARHRAMDHLRRTRRRPVAAVPVEVAAADLTAAQDTAEEVLASIGTGEAVALIATLPRDQAEAVMLRAVVGLDAESAGKVLGKRAGAVRTAAYRGLRTLAGRLGSLPGAESPDRPRPAETAPRPAETAPRPAETAPRPAETAPRPAETAPRPAETAPRPPVPRPGVTRNPGSALRGVR